MRIHITHPDGEKIKGKEPAPIVVSSYQDGYSLYGDGQRISLVIAEKLAGYIMIDPVKQDPLGAIVAGIGRRTGFIPRLTGQAQGRHGCRYRVTLWHNWPGFRTSGSLKVADVYFVISPETREKIRKIQAATTTPEEGTE